MRDLAKRLSQLGKDLAQNSSLELEVRAIKREKEAMREISEATVQAHLISAELESDELKDIALHVERVTGMGDNGILLVSHKDDLLQAVGLTKALNHHHHHTPNLKQFLVFSTPSPSLPPSLTKSPGRRLSLSSD